MSEIDTLLKNLCEYKRLVELATAQFEEEKQKVIGYLKNHNLEEITGIEHKATYKLIKSIRFDSTAFKKDHEELYNQYRKETAARRFTVA